MVRGVYWVRGVYLVPGGGCTWSREWGVPGPGGIPGPGGCVPVLGGVPGPRGVYLVRYPPCEQNHTHL